MWPWAALLRVHAAVVPKLERALARERMPLAWYDVLLELNSAADRRLRMTDLSARVVLSRERVSRVVDELEAAGLVVFRYAPGENHNGSVADIAGVCNEAGNVCGLMPHPEHAVDLLVGRSEDGLRIFESMARAPVGR